MWPKSQAARLLPWTRPSPNRARTNPSPSRVRASRLPPRPPVALQIRTLVLRTAAPAARHQRPTHRRLRRQEKANAPARPPEKRPGREWSAGWRATESPSGRPILTAFSPLRQSPSPTPSLNRKALRRRTRRPARLSLSQARSALAARAARLELDRKDLARREAARKQVQRAAVCRVAVRSAAVRRVAVRRARRLRRWRPRPWHAS